MTLLRYNKYNVYSFRFQSIYYRHYIYFQRKYCDLIVKLLQNSVNPINYSLRLHSPHILRTSTLISFFSFFIRKRCSGDPEETLKQHFRQIDPLIGQFNTFVVSVLQNEHCISDSVLKQHFSAQLFYQE